MTDKYRQLTRVGIQATGASMKLKRAVEELYLLRGFAGNNPSLLMLGLMEELGELAEVVNAVENAEFGNCVRKHHLSKQPRDKIAAEIADVLMYLMALSNHYEVGPDFFQWFEGKYGEQVQEDADKDVAPEQ